MRKLSEIIYTATLLFVGVVMLSSSRRYNDKTTSLNITSTTRTTIHNTRKYKGQRHGNNNTRKNSIHYNTAVRGKASGVCKQNGIVKTLQESAAYDGRTQNAQINLLILGYTDIDFRTVLPESMYVNPAFLSLWKSMFPHCEKEIAQLLMNCHFTSLKSLLRENPKHFNNKHHTSRRISREEHKTIEHHRARQGTQISVADQKLWNTKIRRRSQKTQNILDARNMTTKYETTRNKHDIQRKRNNINDDLHSSQEDEVNHNIGPSLQGDTSTLIEKKSNHAHLYKTSGLGRYDEKFSKLSHECLMNKLHVLFSIPRRVHINHYDSYFHMKNFRLLHIVQDPLSIISRKYQQELQQQQKHRHHEQQQTQQTPKSTSAGELQATPAKVTKIQQDPINDELERLIVYNCNKLIVNHKHTTRLAKKYPRSVMTMRYERFRTKPKEALLDLYGFLGVELTDEFIDNFTKAQANAHHQDPDVIMKQRLQEEMRYHDLVMKECHWINNKLNYTSIT